MRWEDSVNRDAIETLASREWRRVAIDKGGWRGRLGKSRAALGCCAIDRRSRRTELTYEICFVESKQRLLSHHAYTFLTYYITRLLYHITLLTYWNKYMCSN